MAVTIHMELGYEFTVKAPADEVFDLLSDVPKSASHFPKVNALVDLGKNSYRWEMEKIGIASASLQTVYASAYKADKAKGLITWTPVEGEGNALVSGSWTISKAKKGTQVALAIDGDFTLPFPSLMKKVVAPITESEFEKMVEHYIANLIKQFGGEV